jgi:hypothetical protein
MSASAPKRMTGSCPALNWPPHILAFTWNWSRRTTGIVRESSWSARHERLSGFPSMDVHATPSTGDGRPRARGRLALQSSRASSFSSRPPRASGNHFGPCPRGVLPLKKIGWGGSGLPPVNAADTEDPLVMAPWNSRAFTTFVRVSRDGEQTITRAHDVDAAEGYIPAAERTRP